jgi:hypothetical protein
MDELVPRVASDPAQGPDRLRRPVVGHGPGELTVAQPVEDIGEGVGSVDQLLPDDDRVLFVVARARWALVSLHGSKRGSLLRHAPRHPADLDLEDVAGVARVLQRGPHAGSGPGPDIPVEGVDERPGVRAQAAAMPSTGTDA